MNDTKYWLWLTMVFGVGNHRIWEVMSLFTNAFEAYCTLTEGQLNERLSERERSNIHSCSPDDAQELIDKYAEKGIFTIGCGDDEYPRALRHILNPPAVLYYKGKPSCLKGRRAVAAVGARKASDYSINAASRICGELSERGVVIVSGFAVGTDIACHLAAAKNGRPTVCVLGCGVDVDYPFDNIKYRNTILESGGAVISEFPPGTSPHSPNFPKRNRILAALGDVTLVFEASEKSGSLITAGIALEYGKEVFCMPPADIFAQRYSGNIAFLRDGAKSLYSAADIFEYFSFGKSGGKGIPAAPSELFRSFGIGELKPKRIVNTEKTKKNFSVNNPNIKKKNTKKREAAAESVTVAEEKPSYDGELTELQKKITDIVSGGAFHFDIILNKLGIDCGELMTELTEMELLGVIKALPGNMYSLA